VFEFSRLERGRQRVEKDVVALHGELSDDAVIAALDEAMAVVPISTRPTKRSRKRTQLRTAKSPRL